MWCKIIWRSYAEALPHGQIFAVPTNITVVHSDWLITKLFIAEDLPTIQGTFLAASSQCCTSWCNLLLCSGLVSRIGASAAMLFVNHLTMLLPSARTMPDNLGLIVAAAPEEVDDSCHRCSLVALAWHQCFEAAVLPPPRTVPNIPLACLSLDTHTPLSGFLRYRIGIMMLFNLENEMKVLLFLCNCRSSNTTRLVQMQFLLWFPQFEMRTPSKFRGEIWY